MPSRARIVKAASPLAASTIVAAAAFVVVLILVAVIGYSPSDVASAFIKGAFGSERQFAATVATMIPLVLLGLAWVVSASARQINLGLEGQILAGGIGTILVGTHLTGLPPGVHLALIVGGGALAGAAWAAVPAFLYAWREVSVLLSSFMLNFVGLLLVGYLIRGPLQNPGGLGLIESSPISTSSLWPHIGGSPFRWDVMLIPVAVVALIVVQRMTTVGFRLRVVGANESAARRVGISTTRLSAGAVVASGAVAGIAGSSLILDSLTGSLNEGFASGYGFLGIAVALLARNNPVGCIVSALLFAAMQQGGAQVETQVGVPSASVEIAQGLVIMFVALSAWLLVYLGRRRPEKGLSLEVEGSV